MIIGFIGHHWYLVNFELSFTNSIVEKIQVEASYDITSLIGEVGGTIGLTLGLCFLSILEMLLFHFVQKWKNMSLRITMFLLLIPLAHYVVASCFKYMNEPISTVVSFTKGNAIEEFPYLTFCPSRAYNFQGGTFHHEVERGFLFINNTTFTAEDYVWTLSYNIQDIILEPYLSINDKILLLNSDEIWSKVYHKSYGLCYTLDIRKGDAFLQH